MFPRKTSYTLGFYLMAAHEGTHTCLPVTFMSDYGEIASLQDRLVTALGYKQEPDLSLTIIPSVFEHVPTWEEVSACSF